MLDSRQENPTAPQHAGSSSRAPHEDTEDKFRAVLDTAVDGIVLIDSAGVIETFNRAAQQIFGYLASEVIGRNVNLLMPEPFHSEHETFLSNYLKTGQERIIGIRREAAGRRKNGTIFPLELAVSVVKLGDRRMFTGIIHDITERKRLEKEILDVSEREQQRLGHDLHDGLCQELAGIAFLVQSTQQKLASGGVVEPMELGRVTELLQKAVRHARGLSRGLYPVDPQPNGLTVALGDLATNTADVFKIRCTFDCPIPVAMRDPIAATHLFRIVQETVRDAIRHGKAGQVAIELERTKDTLTVTINDDGIGLHDDGRFREDRTLHMMRQRARIIGARLSVKPRDGGGVTVVCELPDRRKSA